MPRSITTLAQLSLAIKKETTAADTAGIAGRLIMASRLIGALLLSTSFLLAQENAQKIAALMEAAYGRGVFNGNVLVRHGADIVYEGSFGYADASRSAPLSSSSSFYIGSIAKEFNGTGILLLCQQGKIKLTDKVSQYLTGYPVWAETIEIRNLLNYTSGLPDVPDSSEDAVRQAISHVTKLAFEPGNAYLYSYANVFLQQRIIEKITGVSYEAFMFSRILGPCGAAVRSDPASHKTAMPFTNSFKPVEFDVSANRSAVFTARDFYNWTACLASGKVLDATSVRELGQSFASGESSLGTAKFDGAKLATHEHQGSGYNNEALIFGDAGEKTTVVLLTNNQNFKLYDLKDAILAILHGQAYTVPKKSIYLDIREGLAADFKQGLAEYFRLRRDDKDEYDLAAEPMDLISTGKYLLRRNNFEEALAFFELSTTFPLRPSDLSYAYEMIAQTWFKQGNKPLAVFYYQKAIGTDPENKNARGLLDSLGQN
jgi:CubicO group peptidase (beta-lactamase class C family)